MDDPKNKLEIKIKEYIERIILKCILKNLLMKQWITQKNQKSKSPITYYYK
jgi:hypothetical protein